MSVTSHYNSSILNRLDSGDPLAADILYTVPPDRQLVASLKTFRKNRLVRAQLVEEFSTQVTIFYQDMDQVDSKLIQSL